MSFTKEKNGGNIRLKIEESLSIYDATFLREALVDCFEDGGDVELDLSGVSDCDTAGLQLLIAARKTAEAMQKPFRVVGTSRVVLDVLRRTGLVPDEIL